MIYFDLLLNLYESNHHEPRSVYNTRNDDYDAVNDISCSHPFDNNIVEANSADNACFTDCR